MRFSACLLSFLTISLSASLIYAQGMERKNVEDKYKWNLSDIFKSTDDWKAEKNKLEQSISKFNSYKGQLNKSADVFYSALKDYFDLYKRFYLLSEFSSRQSDEDLRNSTNQALNQDANALGTRFSEATSFLSPEILSIDQSKIDQFFKDKKELSEFKMFVYDVVRLRDHTLSEPEEKILAGASLFSGTPNDVYAVFSAAEMPYADIKLSDGEDVSLSPAAFTGVRSVPDREDREKVFKSFFENYKKFEKTLGTNFAGKVKADYFFAKSRKYNTVLESSLSGPNIPASVYENLVSQVNKSIPTLQRFLQLKKKMLGVDTLHYYDLYTPIVKEVEFKFNIEEGQDIILNALQPLGADYIATLKKAFTSRWIDYYPTVGKQSGAYSSGAAYDIHPYILTNWNNDYESLTTLAHELGHTMHSYYSNKNQTFANAQYPTFVAEIASTINENFLNDYMVKNAKSDDQKIYLLGSYLELLRLTIFRQTLFAEFELAVHKVIENGESLTGEKMTAIYYDLVKKYYGNNANTCIVDPYIAYEWEYIPHFLAYTYYVFQYSTSLIYATAIAEKIKQEGKPAVDKYYNILKGGSSDYAVNLIKEAGIDPLSSEPFELAMRRMNSVMDQIEQLLANKK